MTDKKVIRGAGGNPSPPSPPQPTRVPDTLHSRQFASFTDVLGEGEQEGSATASKLGLTKGTTAYNNAFLSDVYLNDTPVLQSTADFTSPVTTDFNFQNVGFTPRFGQQTKHISPGEESESVTTVGVTVTTSAPVTRQITNSDVDAVKVSVTFPQIQKATDQGDLLGSSVNLQVQIQYNGGGFSTLVDDTITGRSADAYQKDYRITLTGAFPVDIRVVRVTADSTSSSLMIPFNGQVFQKLLTISKHIQIQPLSI